MQLTKQHLIPTVIGLYIVGSLGYIGYNEWTNFKLNYSVAAFQNGQADTISQLINQAEDPSCQPFSVYNQQKEVRLVNVVCVQSATTDSTDSAE